VKKEKEMQLFMQQKVFSWRDRFKVWDEAENERYFVEGELFSWGKRLHVYDAQGGEAAFIQQKVFSFLPRFYVYVGGEQVAEIVKRFTFFHPRYEIAGLGWEIDGDFFEHDYEIACDGRPIVSIHKQWLSWGDCYCLDIARPEDEIPALAVVLAIDCVNEAAQAAASSASN
jgi:uncharacterized protein YxjI